MSLRPVVALVVASLAVAAAWHAAPAPAQALPPDERAAAREFSYAAYRLRVALKAQREEIDRLVQEGADLLFSEECLPAVIGIVLLPEEQADEAIIVASFVAVAPAVAAMRPAFERFQSELERVPTADPALRSGRAEWRATTAGIALFPATLDVCAILERWRRARYARAAAPLGLGDPPAGIVDETATPPKLARAARRMQQLGVAPGTARRFTGETLLDGIGEDIDVPE